MTAMQRIRITDLEPLCRLVRFSATDGIELSGLLYEPKHPTRRAAIFLHGNGGASVFDSRRTNPLAREFVARGIAWLPFDNRGAQLVRDLRAPRGRRRGGMAHERIRECVADIDGAVRLLRSRGYRELFLVGHSTGANKVAVYDARKPRSPFRGYLLLAGGDDTGLLYDRLGARRFRAALARARERIAAKRGEEIVPIAVSPMMLSWRSFYDMANPDGDYNAFPFLEAMRGIRLGRRRLFRHVAAIRKRALYVYGEQDEYCYGDVACCAAVLADHVGPAAEIVTIEGAGHGFRGFEADLGILMAEWMLT
jgi:pimeloyl-ACP methyl ester carboxylesterase